ncbi:MAG: tetratricopeptide repeat protein [Acidobacteriales bacterium]|nr:tetratricopeptide repeat protein [Terriglobales bacterium]
MNRNVILAAFAFALVGVRASAQTDQPYNHQFGDNPYLPSQAKFEGDGFVSPTDFATAAWCGKCHADIYKQWRESVHANSFREPFYTKNVNLLISTKGIQYTRHCEGCHNPIALFSGALTQGAKVNRAFDQDGITCTVCHSIAKIQNTSGTGSYVMGRPAVILNEDGTPKYGEVSYNEILEHPDLHKRAMMKDFYRTAEFFSACHKAAVPRQLNDYKWQRAFSVYDEWQQSSWAKQSPLPFYKKASVSTCQTCHMQAVAADNDVAAKSGKVVSHRWAAANTAIPEYYGYKDQQAEVEKSLKADLINIDFFALEPENGGLIAPIAQQNYDLKPGETVTVNVVLQNKGIGHSLVPEQRDFYESWVEFTVTDEQDKTVFESGALDPNGYLDPSAHSYTNRILGEDGKFLDRHQVWATHSRALDNTILPGRSDIARFQFRIPNTATGALKLTTRVNYRRFRQGYMDWVLGPGKRYPIVLLAEKSMTVHVGHNVPVETADKSRDRVRWNNWGIGLLDKLQYANSIAAFQKVVELTPDQPDGYQNIAIADISYEHYSAAHQALNKALAIAPDDPRSLYYLGTVLRFEGKLNDAAAAYQAVIAKYPRLRQARQDLGQIYYQQGKNQQAKEQFEALQTIDPDDLGAHYNLMLLYRRLGMKEQAKAQAAYFADRKDDPMNTTLALDYLRKAGPGANESVPWHVHTADHSEHVEAAAKGGTAGK